MFYLATAPWAAAAPCGGGGPRRRRPLAAVALGGGGPWRRRPWRRRPWRQLDKTYFDNIFHNVPYYCKKGLFRTALLAVKNTLNVFRA